VSPNLSSLYYISYTLLLHLVKSLGSQNTLSHVAVASGQACTSPVKRIIITSLLFDLVIGSQPFIRFIFFVVSVLVIYDVSNLIIMMTIVMVMMK